MTAAHDTRAAVEVEQRRLRAKVDDIEDIAAIVFGPTVVELEEDEPQRPRRGLPADPVDEGNALVRAFDRADFGCSGDDESDRPIGFHRGELSVWVGDGYDVGDKPQYERVSWSAGHDHGMHRVITLEEWRTRLKVDQKTATVKRIQRSPNPSQWCVVFAAERTKKSTTYIGCHQPLDLDWPDRNCEFPYQPAVWWRDERPEHCHCNGCLPHPRGHGAKYCCAAHEAVMDNARDREKRRCEGKLSRGVRSELDRAADKRARKFAA